MKAPQRRTTAYGALGGDRLAMGHRQNSTRSADRDPECARPAVTVVGFRPDRQNTRLGFFDLRLDGLGLVVRDVVWHESCGKQFSAMPAAQDSRGKWRPVISFADLGTKTAFQDAVRTAMADYFAKGAR